MIVLIIVHQFLPKHAAGSEYYTYYLAKELQKLGHDVHLYFTEIDHDRPHADMRTGEYDGLPFFEAVNNHKFPSFRHTYKDEVMEANLVSVLDTVKPDIVHIQHLHLHSIGYIDILKERDLKVVFTLHEYILMCHRNGQLLREGMVLCEGPEVSECARCAEMWPMPEMKGELPPPPPEHSEPAPHVEPYSRLSVRRFVGKVRRRLLGESEQVQAAPAPEPEPIPALVPEEEEGPSELYADAVKERLDAIRGGLDQVDLFISPSRFLRDKFIEYGFVKPDRILFSDNGLSQSEFRTVPHTTSQNLRFGYFGTISAWKGIHLIVEAFNGLPESGVECKIYGDLTFLRDYVSELRSDRHNLNVRFMGRFPNTQVAEVLSEIDVLIVPSVWFENSPLTIHEAFIAGVPVVCSDRGGMAELVQDGKNGLHFRLGDAQDLHDKISRLLNEPGLLESLRQGFPEIKGIASDASVMEQRYHALLTGDPVNA